MTWKTYREEILPYYLNLGLSIEFVDESCPNDLLPYVKAHQLKSREENELAWLQGRYVFDAFSVVISRAFSKSSNSEYPKEPYPLFGAKPTKKINTEANEELAMYEFMAYARALERSGKAEVI